MKITFSPTMTWSVDRASMLLYARADGKSTLCVVSQEVLTAPFAECLTEETARAIFHKRKSEIEACLEARIREGTFDSNGEIILLP